MITPEAAAYIAETAIKRAEGSAAKCAALGQHLLRGSAHQRCEDSLQRGMMLDRLYKLATQLQVTLRRCDAAIAELEELDRAERAQKYNGGKV